MPCEIADPDFSAGVFDDPEMRARGSWSATAPDARTVRHFGTTIDFSDTPGHLGAAAARGSALREIMHSTASTTTEIDKLIEVKAVFEERRVS